MAKKNFISRLFSIVDRREPETPEQAETVPAIKFAPDRVVRHITHINDYTSFVYGKRPAEERIKEYWDMFFDPNLNDATTDILDSMIYEEDGNFFTLDVNTDNEDLKKLLQKEFDELFRNRLQLQDYLNLYNIALEWFIEGRLAVQILYDAQAVERGILGINTFPYYLLEEVRKKDENGNETDEVEKYIVETEDMKYELTAFEVIMFDVGLKVGENYYSYYEIAKIPWRKLSLMEDAVIIHKLVRAPMRRAFYIFTGEMPADEAEQFLTEIKDTLHQTVQVNSIGELYNKMNPITLLDDYYIPVDKNGNHLMDVQNIEGSTTWDAMQELKYFTFQVYKALRIPKARMNILGNEETSALVLTGSALGEITKDEFKFSRFIQRLQGRFAKGLLQELFWRHLILKGLVKKFNLRKGTIKISMIRPNYFDELKMQEVTNTRIGNYTQLLADADLNKKWLLKKYLKLSDDEIEEALKKEEPEGEGEF